MSTPCPTCANSVLHDTTLDENLPAATCPDCRGTLLSLIAYRDWRGSHAAPSEAIEDSGEVSHADDNKAMLRCPKCKGFMTKFRFSADATNHIDLCDRCDHVWLDHGEWRLVEQLARSGQLAKVFDATWQQRLRVEQAKRRSEERWREKIGEDYDRARELRAWLAAHPKGKDLVAYLFLSQTEGA